MPKIILDRLIRSPLLPVLAGLLSASSSLQAQTVSFRNDVMPIFSKAGCNAGTCHGNFNGKNGFRLSLRGENSDFDLTNLTRDTLGRRICRFDPECSLLLQKPSGGLPHEGGVRFAPDSQEYATLRRWIAEGCRPDLPGVPHVTRLEVSPTDRVLLHGQTTQQLTARATFSDGSVRDVTRMACYEPNVKIVDISPEGTVRAQQSGEVTVVVRFLDQQVPCRLAFVPERPNFAWKPVPANNYVDRHVFQRLKELQIEPSTLAEDSTFLRRAYLDVCGVLPTPADVKSFLADRDPHKRSKLIDRLLERPEYADFWALKWADLLRNEEKAVDAKGVRLFQGWLRQQVSTDRPLNQFVGDLLTGLGSTYSHPPANYYRTNLESTRAAETTALLFLGVRIACARCHNHPFDRWTQQDYYGLSAFFARVKTRMVVNKRNDRLDKHELNGEMIVYQDRVAELIYPQTGETMAPRLPDGTIAKDRNADRLQVLADWVTAADNPYLARVMANRIWYHLMGRGLVEPVDDFRSSNPASHPALLEELARDLARHQFRQKHLIRIIMNSRAYQLSSRPTPTNKEDETNYARVVPRPLTAEQLLDALSQVTEVPEHFPNLPVGTRAVQLPGVAVAPPFLKVFGRPDRLLACECERQSSATLNQAFQMITGETISRKVLQSPRLGRLLDNHATDKEIITEFYLAALARFATPREVQAISERLEHAVDRRQAVEDLLWAVLNTKEFLLRR
jgi:hypothetical protein